MYRSKSIAGVILACAIAIGVLHGQVADPDLVSGPRAFPQLAIPDVGVIKFIRVFSADQDVNKRKVNLLTDTVTGAPDDSELGKVRKPPKDESAAVALHPHEVVMDFGYAVQPVRIRSPLGALADTVSGLSPNHDLRMTLPHRIAIDSRQRVIVTDPPAHAIHVFDFTRKKYFRIQGGNGRRLQWPTAVTVDAEDNIYATDSGSGLVLVYDPQGKFLRAFGDREGEGVLDQPDGIAIDPETGHLYVSDSPRHLIFIFDHDGNTLARFGTAGKQPAKFGRRGVNGTTDLRLSQHKLILADGNSCALKFFDLQGRLQKEVGIFGGACGLEPRRVGLDVDAAGNIYISDGALGTIRIYDKDGKFLSAFGSSGRRRGELLSPSCVRIGLKGLIYVADSGNRRVQIFELHSEKKRDHAKPFLELWLEKRAKQREEDTTSAAER